MKWKNIRSFFGIAESNTEKVELTDEKLDQVDAGLQQLQELRAENQRLKEEAAIAATEKTNLETKLQQANATIQTLEAKVTELSKLDGAKTTTVKAEGENEKETENPLEMTFQKNLFKQV
ncbi:MAG: hypothetical protein ACTHMV_13585 [Chitinophagaceae bacterium]